MARVLVGLSTLSGDLARYVERFDLVELHPGGSTPTPRPSTLRAWRKTAPPAFVFSVVLPPVVGQLAPGAALDEALASALEVARTVQARTVVLTTPPSVRPTATNEKRLLDVLGRIPREGIVRCWEPMGGLWEPDALARIARASGCVVVLDAARDELLPGPIAYTRLRTLGKAKAFGTATIDRVAERLRGRREAFVVVDAPRDGTRVRTGLLVALGRGPTGSGSGIVRSAIPGRLLAEDEEQ